MLEVESATQSDATNLAKLIYYSGPANLNAIFTGHIKDISDQKRRRICLTFLHAALCRDEGQFGFARQFVIRKDNQAVACASSWFHPQQDEFRQATLDSLLAFFGGVECALILQNSQHLAPLVNPPNEHQLSVGHIAVLPEYRRQGCCASLLAFCEHQARSLGKIQLTLDLATNNVDAMQTYLSFGFSVVSKSEPSEQGRAIGLVSHTQLHKTIDE